MELLAVMIVLSILAAFAIPKYLDSQESSRLKVASSAISEYKGRLNIAYAKLFLNNAGVQPGVADVIAFASTDIGTDFVLTSAAAGTTGVNITVTQVQGVALITDMTGVWVLPTT